MQLPKSFPQRKPRNSRQQRGNGSGSKTSWIRTISRLNICYKDGHTMSILLKKCQEDPQARRTSLLFRPNPRIIHNLYECNWSVTWVWLGKEESGSPTRRIFLTFSLQNRHHVVILVRYVESWKCPYPGSLRSRSISVLVSWVSWFSLR